MIPVPSWIALALVTLLAAAVQGLAGFGFTLVGVSFFLLILALTDAVQLIIALNLVISMALVPRLAGSVPRRLFLTLFAGALAGLPLGIALFRRADLATIEVGVGAVVVVFATSRLARTSHRCSAAADTVDHRTASALATGAVAGAMTSSLGMPGPAAILYLSALRIDKRSLRALALTLFGVLQAAALLLQATSVGIAPRVWTLTAVLAPFALLGAVAGHLCARFVDESTFQRLVSWLLIATGLYMLIQTLVG